MKILSVIGTRPEAIKMAPVIRELGLHGSTMQSLVCVTAQHREMLDQMLMQFGIAPDYDLDVMGQQQSPARVASAVLSRIEPILAKERPDWLLVQGDTTTVMAAAVAAFYARVKVGHVEAGLRTFRRDQPFPEEINRRIAGVVADLHFAPTEEARRNLLAEGTPPDRVVVTGNPVIDALRMAVRLPYDWSAGPLRGLPSDRRLLLVTAHRRENFGAPLTQICLALRDLADRYRDSVHIVYPVHPNPEIHEPVHRMLGRIPGITLLPPLDYLSLAHLLTRSHLVLTDSGGLQEEAPDLGVPVLVLRATTERPEGVEAGTALLVGTDREVIVGRAATLLDDEEAYRHMSRAMNPYGDGQAARRIVEVLQAVESCSS